MFIGEYTHTLDSKKRVKVPKKFASELGDRVVLTRGLDNCIFLFPYKEWEKIVERMQNLSFTNKDTRGFMRFMFSGASEVEIDKAGRILIPDNLKEFAKLKDKVVLAGVSDRIEIWDKQKWEKYTKEVEKEGEQLAENLKDIL